MTAKQCTIWVYLTRACNLRCHYCYQEHISRRMTETTGRAVIRWGLENLKKSNMEKAQILFYGGEPLLNRKVFEDMVLHAEDIGSKEGKKFSFFLLSNATLFNREVLRFLEDHNIDVQISVDGPPDIHNRHRVTVKGHGSFEKIGGDIPLKELASHRISLASMVVEPETTHRLSESVEFLVDLGFRKMVFHLALEKEHDWSPAHLDVFRGEVQKLLKISQFSMDDGKLTPEIFIQPLAGMLQKNFKFNLDPLSPEKRSCLDKNVMCNAGRTDWTIDHQGDIYPCSRIVDDIGAGQLREAHRIGNVHLGIWNYRNLQNFREWLPRSKKSDKCSTCQWKYICPHQCYALFLGTNGSTSEPWHSICDTTTVMAQEINRYLKENHYVPHTDHYFDRQVQLGL